MMNRVWTCVLIGSVICGLVCGNVQEMGDALLTAGDDAVKLMLTLLASMTLWSGLMEILSETGDVRRLGRQIRRWAGWLFGDVRDEACWDAMSMNLSANLLGLGNAATPAGVRAAQLLAGQGQAGMTALAAFLALNNAGLQLLPTTVITLRRAAGSIDPAGIWGLSLTAAGVSAAVSMVSLLVFRRAGAGGRGR